MGRATIGGSYLSYLYCTKRAAQFHGMAEKLFDEPTCFVD